MGEQDWSEAAEETSFSDREPWKVEDEE